MPHKLRGCLYAMAASPKWYYAGMAVGNLALKTAYDITGSTKIDMFQEHMVPTGYLLAAEAASWLKLFPPARVALLGGAGLFAAFGIWEAAHYKDYVTWGSCALDSGMDFMMAGMLAYDALPGILKPRAAAAPGR